LFTEGNEGKKVGLDRINRIYWIILNRKGAKGAKGRFGWFILILEERPRIKIPNRWREFSVQRDVGNKASFFYLSRIFRNFSSFTIWIP